MNRRSVPLDHPTILVPKNQIVIHLFFYRNVWVSGSRILSNSDKMIGISNNNWKVINVTFFNLLSFASLNNETTVRIDFLEGDHGQQKAAKWEG